jgi:thiamine biosynthesis protein ThiS
VQNLIVNVTVNGELRQLPDGADLVYLLSELSLPSQRVAVEVNKVVIRRSDWDVQQLMDGDRVEIVHFVGGG